jgi:lysozyme
VSGEDEEEGGMPDGLQGIDVSVFQGTVDWTRVAKANIAFAICRATIGTGLDSTFVANFNGARAAGLVVGAYGVLEPGGDPIAQADAFANAVSSVGADGSTLPPALDFEIAGTGIHDAAVSWVQQVEARTGRRSMIYTGNWFWEQIKAPAASALASRPLWISSYTAAPILPAAWKDWAIWQWGGEHSGAVDGVPSGNSVDHDVFRGSIGDLRQWIAQTVLGAEETSTPLVTTQRAQQILLQLGYDLGPTRADGALGPITAAALRGFQTAGGLPQTGIVDAATSAALITSSADGPA